MRIYSDCMKSEVPVHGSGVQTARGSAEESSKVLAVTATRLDGMAVRAHCDHVGRVIFAASSKIVHVIDFQNRLSVPRQSSEVGIRALWVLATAG